MYAGRLLPDNRTGNSEITHHGAIYITTLLSNGEIEHYLRSTKGEIGTLSILNVNRNGRVTLVSDGYEEKTSDQLYFDIPALQFVSSLE